ncbi:hypothetical protein JOQ06_023910, partial [Pogonophryne albipinna]
IEVKKFVVKGPTQTYDVDLELCSCPAGQTGAPCKHQAAVMKHYSCLSHSFLPINPEMRAELMKLTSAGNMFRKVKPQTEHAQPEALSAARAAGFNPTVVKKWFEKYKDTIETLGLENAPDHIWNCNETGLHDHFLSTRAVAEVGAPCLRSLVESINAAGGYGPTMIIFKGKRMKPDWLFGAQKNTFVKMSDNGLINSDLFTEWGIGFCKVQNPRPHLLLVGGHTSHVYNIDFLNMMRENNVHVFSLPPHTTHYLQPADRALFKSLKHYWRLEGRRISRESGGKRLDRALFMPLFSKAWMKAATPLNGQAGFRGSAIYPFNPAKINENLFISERCFQETPEHLTEHNQILQGNISCLEDIVNTQEEVGENMGPIMEREQMGLASADQLETHVAEPPSPSPQGPLCTFSSSQRKELKRVFALTPSPDSFTRGELAEQWDLTSEQVKVWFQNERRRLNLKQQLK